MQNSMVSVIIPVYNGEKYLKEAIDSVLAQTYPNIEIIVVNDGSTDTTEKICLSYANYIRYFKQKNQGCATALNKGIKNVLGDYIGILSYDDIWLTTKIEKQMRSFSRNTADIIFHDSIKFSGKVPELSSIKSKTKTSLRRRRKAKNMLRELLLGNVINAITPLIRKDCFNKAGLFDSTLLNAEDYELWLRFAMFGFRFFYIDEVLSLIRLHEKNKSSNFKRMRYARLKILNKIFSYPHFPKSYLKYKNKVFARAYRENALPYYNAGYYKEFRKDFYNILKLDFTAITPKIFCRFLKSYLKEHI